MDNQFYPTPSGLAHRAFALFENQNVVRLLEGSAGRGDMLEALSSKGRYSRAFESDCVEIDFDNQAVLRGKGYRVVGHDFLQFNGGAAYSHILINPPFAHGVHHALHAWDLLVDGELVAILNAETIRNPCDKYRQLLVNLIDAHGSVEFLQEEFMVGEVKRKTMVEIALVHLKRESNFNSEFLGKLRKEVIAETSVSEDLGENTEIVLKDRFVNSQVDAFKCAIRAARLAAMEKARAAYYASMLGRSITDFTTATDGDPKSVADKEYNETYQSLKECAWSSILRSSMVMDRMGSQAQRRLESQFADVSALDFTVDNIYAFLSGLVGQQGQIQAEMACDVFDNFGKYHPNNRVHYAGWKSNQRHRINAFRLKMTRLILPACSPSWYESGFVSSLYYDDSQRFRDFDKVFAMLDGKTEEQIFGLRDLCETPGAFSALCSGERLASDYFELRFYRGTGTFHLFPTNNDVIERLNRVVGKHRAWLPHEESTAAEGFWTQYERAEEVARKMDLRNIVEWELNHGSERHKGEMAAKLLRAHQDALQALGIEFDPESALEHYEEMSLPAPEQQAA